jgi:hypothetical protein
MLAPPPNLDETMRLLPGPYFSRGASATAPDGREAEAASASTAEAQQAGSAGASSSGGGARLPVTLVCFVGGCTYAEIAAIRWLARNGTPRRQYLIATTHICNGDTFMEELMTTCENTLEKLDA